MAAAELADLATRLTDCGQTALCELLDALYVQEKAGNTVILSWNILASNMYTEQHFHGPTMIEKGEREERLRQILSFFLGRRVVLCLQEVDDQNRTMIESILPADYRMIYSKGFRFGNAILAPKDSLGDFGVFRVTKYPIPSNLVVREGLREEWAKRENTLVYAEINGVPLFTTHFPVSLKDPSMKVLYWDAVQAQIRWIAKAPHILMVDANTMPTEYTIRHILGKTSPGSIPEAYSPWDGYERPPENSEYVQLTTLEPSNHNLSPKGKPFSARLDYCFVSPDLKTKDTLSSHIARLNMTMLATPAPHKDWPSDHGLVGVVIPKPV